MADRGGVAELLRSGYERVPREGVAAIGPIVEISEDLLIVPLAIAGSGSLSGASVESRFGPVYEVENWRAKRMTFYFDPDRALESAGS